MKKAAEGKAWAQKARDPATYLAERIMSTAEAPEISHIKRAEYRFALEMLADEMGVKNEMLKVLASRQRQSAR